VPSGIIKITTPTFFNVSLVSTPSHNPSFFVPITVDMRMSHYGLDVCKRCTSRFCGCFIVMRRSHFGEAFIDKKEFTTLRESILDAFGRRPVFYNAESLCVKDYILIGTNRDSGEKNYKVLEWNKQFVLNAVNHFTQGEEVCPSTNQQPSSQ